MEKEFPSKFNGDLLFHLFGDDYSYSSNMKVMTSGDANAPTIVPTSRWATYLTFMQKIYRLTPYMNQMYTALKQSLIGGLAVYIYIYYIYIFLVETK